MKKMLTLIIFGVLTTSSLTAQNYSKRGLTLKNNSQIDGRIAINYTSQTVVVKKDYKTTTYRFDQIASANLKNRTSNKI